MRDNFVPTWAPDPLHWRLKCFCLNHAVFLDRNKHTSQKDLAQRENSIHILLSDSLANDTAFHSLLKRITVFLAETLSRSRRIPSTWKETGLRSGYNLLYFTLPGEKSKIKDEQESKKQKRSRARSGGKVKELQAVFSVDPLLWCLPGNAGLRLLTQKSSKRHRIINSAVIKVRQD